MLKYLSPPESEFSIAFLQGSQRLHTIEGLVDVGWRTIAGEQESHLEGSFRIPLV